MDRYYVYPTEDDELAMYHNGEMITLQRAINDLNALSKFKDDIVLILSKLEDDQKGK